MEGWDNFFLGQVGASAALVGLLFVAVSLNLTRILSFAILPRRAMIALGLLLSFLLVSSLMLIPGQPRIVVGLEALLVGPVLIRLWVSVRQRLPNGMSSSDPVKAVANILFLVLQCCPMSRV